jgi:hypothetical protein
MSKEADKVMAVTLVAGDALLFLLGAFGAYQHRFLGFVVILLALWFGYKTFKYIKG